MMDKIMFITDFDMKRFSWLISNSNRFSSIDNRYLSELKDGLSKAVVVQPQEIPSDVVTMSSKVRLKFLDSNEEITYTLVFPFDADLSQGKLSVLAPLGVAIIGCRIGDEADWDVQSAKRKVRIEGILYQPEAAGNYYI
ncbi:MAG: transcription elongation factor GreAB [Ignavibacteria bacterium]|jgi:regulator of nucleoside diphosphate kinase|nr:transcription elongation factor GreAB [Ignavibacteria bacterium]MCU7503359.1 transcription elongation factor GreAB [Ignavibacteria bacterium]MCU7515695.1 transcription elongation factor GreAB [Ignavibacteria bacterium]